MIRFLALVIAAIGIAMSTEPSAVQFVLSYADWYWWLLLWVVAPILCVISLILVLGASVTGFDKTNSLVVGLAAGAFSGFLAVVLLGIGLGMSLAETWFLYEAYKNSTDIMKPETQSFVIFVVLFILNMLRGAVTKTSNNTSKG
jgi:hypothetical protein